MGYKFREFEIPDYMMSGLERYKNYGRAPGGFLEKIICNDFVMATGHADDNNIKVLPAYAAYLYNELPRGAWGSEQIYNQWTAQGGLYGKKYPRSDWEYQVRNGDTVLGYKDWVDHCVERDGEE